MAIGVSACQTAKLERGTSIRLTADQLRDIKESVIWDLRQSLHIRTDDLGTVKFGKIAATKDSKGLDVVCGYIRLRETDGSYTDEFLFLGFSQDYPARLHNDRLLTSFLGRTPEATERLLSTCRGFGVEL